MQKKRRNIRRLSWIETGAEWLLAGGANWAAGQFDKRSRLVEDITNEDERDYLAAYWGIHSERIIAERAERFPEQCLPCGWFLFESGLTWEEACRKFDKDSEEAECKWLDDEEKALDAKFAEAAACWKKEDVEAEAKKESCSAGNNSKKKKQKPNI